MKIAVAGLGYVGLSNAMLLARHNKVVAFDVVPAKVDMLNRRESPIVDAEIEHFLKHEKLDFKATLDATEAFEGADVIIVATPTNYDTVTNQFDTSSIEAVVRQIMPLNRTATHWSTAETKASRVCCMPRASKVLVASARSRSSSRR